MFPITVKGKRKKKGCGILHFFLLYLLLECPLLCQSWHVSRFSSLEHNLFVSNHDSKTHDKNTHVAVWVWVWVGGGAGGSSQGSQEGGSSPLALSGWQKCPCDPAGFSASSGYVHTFVIWSKVNFSFKIVTISQATFWCCNASRCSLHVTCRNVLPFLPVLCWGVITECLDKV